MNKLDSSPQTFKLSPVSCPDVAPSPGRSSEPVYRLIVLVPCQITDPATLTRRVWELAKVKGAHVQFLGLCNDPVQESSLKRELITMSAMVKDDNISTETDILFGKDWLAVVKSRSRPGDMVVCFAEQHANGSSQTLGRILQTNLEAPLYIVSGLRPDNKADSNWLAQFVAWSGSIALIFGFFLLQVKIDHIGKDWTHLTLLLLTIPAELWLIWMWNNLFG